MAAGIVSITILDGASAARTIEYWSSDGTAAGLLYPLVLPQQSAGVLMDAAHPLFDDIRMLGGVAVALNSGNVSTGTLRVVLATDQVQLTNAWKVDGSAVMQPVSGTFWQATQPVSGTFWQATQPASIVAGAARIGEVLVKSSAPAAATSVSVTTISAAIDLAEERLFAIQMDTAWTAAAITFQASQDGTNYFDLYDQAGEVTISSAVALASKMIVVDPSVFMGFRYLKVRSGTSAAGVTQGAGRTLQAVTAPR